MWVGRRGIEQKEIQNQGMVFPWLWRKRNENTVDFHSNTVDGVFVKRVFLDA